MSSTWRDWQPPRVEATDRSWDNKFTVEGWWTKYLSGHQIIHKPQLFSQFVGKGDIVFDIGANRGGMTHLFRQLGARVIAVEPLHQIAPDRVKEFHWKFKNDDDVILLPVAVSPQESVRLAMPDTPNHWIITTASARWRKESAHSHIYKRVIEKIVTAVTLDNLVEWFGVPSFIKVDVEGYGAEVISTLHYPVQALNMEFHRDWLWNNQAAMAHLHTLGRYEYNYVLDNRGELVLNEWKTGAQLMTWLKTHLTEKGKGSWGDIYARLHSA